MQDFIKQLEQIKTTDDLLVEFTCGHVVFNPQARIQPCSNTIRGYVCPICGTLKRRHATWIRCRGKGCERIIQRTDKRPIKYCPTCRNEIALAHSRRRSKHNLSTIKSMHDHDYDVTLDEIGRELGVTRERARQIMVQALTKFRRNWERMYGRECPISGLPEESGGFVYRGLK